MKKDIKNIIISICLLFLPFTILYLSGAFITWSFDCSTWATEVRSWVIIVSLLVGTLLIAFKNSNF